MNYAAPNTPLWCDRPENKTRFWQELTNLEQLAGGKGVEVKRLADKAIFVLETSQPEVYKIHLTTEANYPQVAPTVLAERNGKAVRVKSATLNHWRPEAYLAEIAKEISAAPAGRNLVVIGGVLGGLVLLVILACTFLVLTSIFTSENQWEAAVLYLQEKQAADLRLSAVEARKSEIERQLKNDPTNIALQDELRKAEDELAYSLEVKEEADAKAAAAIVEMDKAKQTEVAVNAEYTAKAIVTAAKANAIAAAATANAPTPTVKVNAAPVAGYSTPIVPTAVPTFLKL
ncbi:MAG: hypothetical protein HXX20_23155 [Chloroflexi bacterium]|nr:hypothetical protein [Chloroflexota bacterium]